VLTREFVVAFAEDWVEAWNARDLAAVVDHYADDVTFHSPRIRAVTGQDVDRVVGKEALRAYWQAALERAPELHFEIDRVLLGSDCCTILYRNHRRESVAETFVFSGGSVVQAIACSAPTD